MPAQSPIPQIQSGMNPTQVIGAAEGQAGIPQPDDPMQILAGITTGNQHLTVRPNLVAQLASGNATPAQASAANQFVGALEAENAVAQMRAQHVQAVLPTQMQQSLDAVGAQYSDVSLTAQQALQKQVATITASGQVPVFNNGQLIGARAQTQQEQNKGQDGWFDSLGGFWHHLVHNPVTNVIGEGYNVSAGALGNLFSPNSGILDPGGETSQLMRTMGYDPMSPLSKLAFAAKGYDRGDLTGVVNRYGQEAVNTAEQYLADPKTYTENMIAQANAQDPTGALAAQKMQQLSTQDFGDVLREVGGRQASLGTDLATQVGLDPVKNPTAYAWVSGGTNFVASLFTDPTILVGKYAAAVKMSQIGIRGLNDTSSMAKILDLSNGSLYARAVQRGGQFAVDSGNAIREGQVAMTAAQAAGDLDKYATAQAQVAQGMSGLRRVGLQELAPALTGSLKATGLAEDGTLITEIGGEPLDTYDKLFDYIVHQHGLEVLKSGKAAINSSLMPGALSRFGASAVRASLDETKAGVAKWFNLRKLEAATKIIPTPIDAVDVASGEHLSQAVMDQADAAAAAMDATKAADSAVQTGLASQARATAFPSDAAIGQVQYNLRRYGNLMGDQATGLAAIGTKLGAGVSLPGRLGEKLGELTPGSWLNPFAVTARARLAARRLNVTNILPRNNQLNLLDEQAPQQVLAFARTYLPEQQSLMMAASFAAGDIGARRAIWQGLRDQVFHTAGIYHTESGRELAQRFAEDDAAIYTHSVDGVMPTDPWTGQQDLSSALWAAQNRTVYTMPTFTQLHRAAAKMGIYESVIGRMMVSPIADAIGSGIRTSMLLTPRTATRATVEGWVNMLARGDARGALAMKAKLAEHGDTFLPKRTWATTKATGWFLPRAVGSLIKNLEKRAMTGQEAEFLDRVAEKYPEVAEQVQESLAQHLLRGDVHPEEASADILAIARAGFKPAVWERSGFAPQSTSGYEGAHRLEAALQLRQSGNPQTFKAILDYLVDPTAESHLKILDAMKSPEELQNFRHMRWTNVWRDGDETAPLQRAVTEEQREIALQQHAVRLTSDLRTLLTGQGRNAELDATGKVVTPAANPALSMKLVDKLRGTDEVPGEVPDGDWINENLAAHERPLSAIAPTYMAKVVEDSDGPLAGMQKVAQSLQDLTGNAYKMMVTRPAERMTSMPAFWNNYVHARVESADLERQLVEEHGYTAETADRALMMRAIRQSWVRTEATVDDPGLKTQIDVVGRNLLGFPRAVNAFIRRYGQLVKQDPFVLRKAFLTLQGAEQTGLVYKDVNGELTYTVPGSNFMVNALNQLGKALGYENLVQLPTGDLTGKVLLSAPGFDNPIRPSLSPMLNIPFRFIANLFPDHREMVAEIDGVLNGAQGSGRSWQSELMPALFSRWYEALDPHEQNNLLASTFHGAFANLVAADPNGSKGIWLKPGTDPTGAEMSAKLATLKTAVRGQLLARAALGMFLPGAPSRPEDNTSGSHPDEAYYLRGARSLSDEFKMMLNDFNGDFGMAQTAFLAAHPNGLIYGMPSTTVTNAHANVGATRQSEAWMEKNIDLIRQYPNVAAYFAPPSTGKFDANAWQAQKDLGLRKDLSINDFVNNWELKVAQNEYFTAYDKMKQARDSANAAGQTREATAIQKNFTNTVLPPFLAANPILQDWLTLGDAQKASEGRKGIAQLRTMLQDPKAAGLQNMDAASEMLKAWDVHQSYQQNPSAYTSSQLKTETAQLGTYMEGIVAQRPELAGLYDMFRAVDYKSLPSLSGIKNTTQGGLT